MRETSSDLESTLDGLIARLTRASAAKGAKALLVDARRLRTVVGNWRTIDPTDEARKEMGARVEQLCRTVDVTAPVEVAPLPSPPPPLGAPRKERPSFPIVEEIRPGAINEPSSLRRSSARSGPVGDSSQPPPATSARSDGAPSAAARSADPVTAPRRVASPALDPVIFVRREAISSVPPQSAPPVVAARSAPPTVEEVTRAAPIATQRHASEERATARDVQQSLPRDAQQTSSRDGPQSLARVNGSGELVRLRTLPDLDISGIAELVDEGPAFDDPLDGGRGAARSRDRQSSAPPGRRRVDALTPTGERAGGSDRPTRAAARPSRYLIDSENEAEGDERAGLVYPGAAVPEDSPVPARAAARLSRVPIEPVAPLREGRSAIAVRPLPAPEVLDPRLLLLTDPYSPRADAYRALRRKLSGPGAPRTIAVTSAQAGEGKTSCAANLALAFRETSSERILLVEANLRSPSLAKLFGFETPVCFAKQMARNRESSRASWTVVEQFEPLHVLAVDPAAKNPPLLDPVAFANALEQLVDAGYDHIIIDTPPALGGPDVNLVADAVDGIIVVAWIKKSKRSLVKKAIDQLKPATILGVVTLES